MNIAQVMIFVSDIEIAKSFYSSIIGLKVSQDLSAEMNMLIMQNDSCIFTIHGGHAPSTYSDSTKISVCFKVDDIDRELKRLKTLDVRLIGEIVETPVHRYQVLLDPDDNLIEIGQYH